VDKQVEQISRDESNYLAGLTESLNVSVQIKTHLLLTRTYHRDTCSANAVIRFYQNMRRELHIQIALPNVTKCMLGKVTV